MIITHASAEKIEKLVASYCLQKGCLFFAAEGNEYNLAGHCEYQYNLEINPDNTIEVEKLFFQHDSDCKIVQSVMRNMMISLDLDEDDLELAEALLEESASIFDYADEIEEVAEAAWMVQQYQGILAHKLGYDAAEIFDEQGAAYVVYCVDKKLDEVKL